MTTQTHTNTTKWSTTAAIAIAAFVASFILFSVDTIGRLTKSDILHDTLTAVMVISIAVWSVAAVITFDRKDPAKRPGLLKVGGLLMLGALASLLLNLLVLNPIAASIYDSGNLAGALDMILTFGPLDTVTTAFVPLLFFPGLILAVVGYLRRILKAIEGR